MVLAERRLASPGHALMLIGLGHAAWGLLAYHGPPCEIARARVVGSVGDAILEPVHDRGPHAAGFWFMLAAPLVRLTDYLSDAALPAGDRQAARIAGRSVLAPSAVGTVAIPRSGFPVAAPIGYWLLRRAHGTDARVPDRLRAARSRAGT